MHAKKAAALRMFAGFPNSNIKFRALAQRSMLITNF
jgi:hypothetical protein